MYVDARTWKSNDELMGQPTGESTHNPVFDSLSWRGEAIPLKPQSRQQACVGQVQIVSEWRLRSKGQGLI